MIGLHYRLLGMLFFFHYIALSLCPFGVDPNGPNIWPSQVQGRKCRDISTIYRVSNGISTIFHGEISIQRYFGINFEKSTISHDMSVVLP